MADSVVDPVIGVPVIRLSKGKIWEVTIDGQRYQIVAVTKGDARALLKGYLKKPLPVGLDLVEAQRPTTNFEFERELATAVQEG